MRIALALFRLKNYRKILFVLVDQSLTPAQKQNKRGLKLRENVVKLGRIYLKELLCNFVEKSNGMLVSLSALSEV